MAGYGLSQLARASLAFASSRLQHGNPSLDFIMSLSQPTRQAELDLANMAFWDELCGSYDARALGIVDKLG